MTKEECRFYLRSEVCPESREGASSVTVPGVVGSPELEARSTLEAAGFRVKVAFTRPTTDPELDGVVAVQAPVRSAQTAAGSTVVLVLFRYVAP